MIESISVERPHEPLPAPPNVRISVINFGPIASASVDLRPLTVFVGPSNTGKTYLAVLIYALHRVLDGFPRIPIVGNFSDDLTREELLHLMEKLEMTGRPFRFSDLPDSMCSAARSAFHDPSWLRKELEFELLRCFDPESISELIRFASHPDCTKVSLEVGEQGRDLWRFQAEISEPGISVDGHIEDVVLLPEGWATSELASNRRFKRPAPRGGSWPLLHGILRAAGCRGGDAHYLPATRSGIVQSHRIISKSVMKRATRVGLEGIAELPTFSGVNVDFMERLLSYEGDRRDNKFAHMVGGNLVLMSEIADALEEEVLAGQIRANRPSDETPEFVYRLRREGKDIRLAQASSMVSELAPVVLFLRGVVQSGDMLAIEEPEAHLHPAAQTKMAATVARLVRAGVRVVVTTHSDWFLQEIGNLIREGNLEEQGEPAAERDLPSSLRPNDVGVWLFRKDNGKMGSTVHKIEFDRSEGVEPEEYEDVAEALYNRSANLQNRLGEISGAADRGIE